MSRVRCSGYRSRVRGVPWPGPRAAYPDAARDLRDLFACTRRRAGPLALPGSCFTEAFSAFAFDGSPPPRPGCPSPLASGYFELLCCL